MMWLFKNKKEYQDYYNEAFLLATFSPKENLGKLKKKYVSLKKSNTNNKILKAKMSGFMDGLEKRNRSRLSILEESLNQEKEREERESRADALKNKFNFPTKY